MRTFNNLRGLIVTESAVNSDGNTIKGTEEDKVVLFNEKIISFKEICKLTGDQLYELEQSGKVIIIPKYVAINLSD